ncbi:histidine phosphatase family protein [bacterium]|nr:histidine phosphatase family protein [bacterium]MBU1989224.1 histidine phosphatase family protein [bacterium]
MKKLYIIRHAKSSWKDKKLGDFERPLNKRGMLDAPFMGNLLKSRGVIPDIILLSPALRTKTTAEMIANTLKFTKSIVMNKDIYEAGANTLHKIVTKIDDKNETAFLIGHNPGLNMLAERYVDMYDNIPTCGIVEIEFDCESWRQISPENAKFISFEYPKKYKVETDR